MRKARNTMSKKKDLDFTKPIPLEIIGSEDDPCFGKLHDPTSPTCGRCGDSEICVIVQAQKMNGKRKKIEKKSKFKDITPAKKKKKKK